MKNNTHVIKLIALFLVISILTVAFMGGCTNKTNSNSNSTGNTVSDNQSQNQSLGGESQLPDDNDNSVIQSPTISNNSSKPQNTVKVSDVPNVTVATQVAPRICIVAGSCPKGTEYVNVKGDGITTTKIVPYAGKNEDYFIGQVKIYRSTTVEVSAKEKGKTISDEVSRYVNFDAGFSENYMEAHEYRPVIGLNSRAHFYSALLSYTLSSDKITAKIRSQAESNISNLVKKASAVGAETIFLIIPSSAEIYPETVPAGYPKTSGETIYEAFEKIATQAGAKVIYPLDTMKKHKNDGVGYQLYQHTDSHWSAYGAYWGTYDLFNYIAKTYPAAKPRTVKEMGFYTAELYGGDAVFNFPSGIGFDNDTASGITSKTEIKELTTLYNLKTSSNTLSAVYHKNTGLYLTNDNKAAKTVYNNTPSGLPNAVIMRDSFGKVAFDMVSDRFATACWGEFDNYNFPKNWESTNPDYVIHLYSERNLFKIMLSNSSASIVGFK